MIVNITLSQEEMADAKEWGRQRQEITSKLKKDAHKFSGDGVKAHTDGVISEYAVAIAFDLLDEWIPVVENYKDIKADVADVINVRGTKHEGGRLILHKKDLIFEEGKDRFYHPFVLAIQKGPRVDLKGWTWPDEGAQDRFWCDPTQGGRPAFFVPQYELYPMEELESFLYDHTAS